MTDDTFDPDSKIEAEISPKETKVGYYCIIL